MNIISNIDKIWDFMYVKSVDYLYTEFSEKEISELTLRDRDYIKLIYRLKNPKISEIAEHMGYTKTSATNMINKLEKKGYVERIKSKMDKREVNVKLTEKGLFLFKWKEETYKEILKEILVILNEKELENFDEILEKIGKRIDERIDEKRHLNPKTDLINPVIPINILRNK